MIETKEGVVILIKVVPNAGKNALAGWENEELKVRLNAVPEKGEANTALVAFLAKTLGIAKSQIEILRGEKSRHKKVLFRSICIESLRKMLIP